jgi:hypothetical protein
MADPLGTLKKTAQDLKSRYDAGNKETEGLGSELSAKSDMMKQGRAALSSGASGVTGQPKSAPSKPSPKDLVNPGGKPYGSGPGEVRLDSEGNKIPSKKKGGPINKTGIYQLHKGEHVIPARAASALGGKKTAKKGSGKVPHKMVIEQNDDNSFAIEHQHKPSSDPSQPSQPTEKFSAPNAKHLVRHVKQTYGQQGSDDGMAFPSSYADGGMVQKGGMAQVHAGETVLPAVKNPDIYLGGKAPVAAPMRKTLARPRQIKPIPTNPGDMSRSLQSI